MKRKFLILVTFMGSSLFASTELCPENSGIDYYAQTCELFEATLRDTRECTLKDVLISNFETAQKNDAEYFFKNYLDPKMDTILEQKEDFETKQRIKIEKLHKKFENLKKFSEKYCEYQTALIAADTGIESLQAILENMILYKKLKNNIALEITECYDKTKEMPTRSVNKQEPEIVIEKTESKKEDPILLERQLKEFRELVDESKDYTITISTSSTSTDN